MIGLLYRLFPPMPKPLRKMTSEEILADGQVYRSGVYEGRNVVESVGGGYIMDRADFWDKRFAEGRHPFRDHDFQISDDMEEIDDDLLLRLDPTGEQLRLSYQYRRNIALCRRCGERREVYAPAIKMETLNYGWCV